MWIDDYIIVITLMSTFLEISFGSLRLRNDKPLVTHAEPHRTWATTTKDRRSRMPATRSSWVQVRLPMHTLRARTTRPSARIRALIPLLRATGHVSAKVDSKACGSKVDRAVFLRFFLWIAGPTWGRNVDRHRSCTRAHRAKPTRHFERPTCTEFGRCSATMRP